MIKCEAVFDGDSIIVNGKKFTVADTVTIGEDGLDGLDEYSTIEQAVKYCMEH